MRVANSTALMQFAFVALSFLALTICYVTSDFSVVNVFENSHSLMPLIYKITGVWGNHEGSMLLWVLMLSLFAAPVAVFAAICRRHCRRMCSPCNPGSRAPLFCLFS